MKIQVVTVLATTDANIGAIHAILPDLQELLEPTRQSLVGTSGNSLRTKTR